MAVYVKMIKKFDDEKRDVYKRQGTTIESNGGLVLMAKEGIRLESMTGIAMQGMSDIMALYAEGASSLCVNGSVDMLDVYKRQVSGKCLVDREDFICYDVVTRTSLSLGDRVTYEGRELLVSRKKTELAGGEVIFTYRLAGKSYTWVPWEDNPDYTGMSFVGSIDGTQGELVEVAFYIDKTAAGGNRYGFAPATGNLMYCMPQKGTKTSLYICLLYTSAKAVDIKKAICELENVNIPFEVIPEFNYC